jgi:hypothetical protein
VTQDRENWQALLNEMGPYVAHNVDKLTGEYINLFHIVTNRNLYFITVENSVHAIASVSSHTKLPWQKIVRANNPS